MAFVVLQPGSNSNPGSKYRVADSVDVMRFLNGASLSYGYTEFSTFLEARVARDLANSPK